MTEALIAELSKVDQLAVISQRSTEVRSLWAEVASDLTRQMRVVVKFEEWQRGMVYWQEALDKSTFLFR